MYAFTETYDQPSRDETSTIRGMLLRVSAEDMRNFAEDYEVQWLRKDEGARAAAWMNFRAAYDKGLLDMWVALAR